MYTISTVSYPPFGNQPCRGEPPHRVMPWWLVQSRSLPLIWWPAVLLALPLVVESLGGWSNEAADTITKIGRLQGQRLGVPPAESIHHLFQHCAIALWRGNASMWIRRLPAHPPMVDGILWLVIVTHFLLFSFCACSPCFFPFFLVCIFHTSALAVLLHSWLTLPLPWLILYFPLFFCFCVPILANPLLALCLDLFFIVPLFFCFCVPFCPAVQG